MRNKRIKRIISFVLSLCMVMAVGGIMPQTGAEAAVINTNFLKTYVDLEPGQTESVLKNNVSVPTGTTLTYSVKSGTNYISISSSGTITAKTNYGSAVVTVGWANGSNSGTVDIPVEVIQLKSGYYYMHPASSPCCMTAKDGDTTPGATLTCWLQTNSVVKLNYYRVWRVKYVGNGYYTIRCSYMPELAVAVGTGDSVTTILNDVETETTSTVPEEALWYITKNISSSTTYVTEYKVQSKKSLDRYLAGTYSLNENVEVNTALWGQAFPTERAALWVFNTYAECSFADAFIPEPSTVVSIGNTLKNPIKPIIFSIECLKQDCTFTSSNSSILAVYQSGSVKGVSKGKATVTIKSKYDAGAYFTREIGVVDIKKAAFVYVKNANSSYNSISYWVNSTFANESDCRSITEHNIQTVMTDLEFWNTMRTAQSDLLVYRGKGVKEASGASGQIDLGVSSSGSNSFTVQDATTLRNTYGSNCLSYNKVALIVASYSGYTSGVSDSLAGAISSATSGSVVGFKGEIDESKANEWTKDFLTHYYSPASGTIEASCRYASEKNSNASLKINNVVIK